MPKSKDSNISIIISPPVNRGKVQLPYATKIKTILNQLSKVVYGKPIDECWGNAQNVLVSQLKGKTIRIILPERDDETQTNDVVKNENAIQNIVNHVKERGIDIAIS